MAKHIVPPATAEQIMRTLGVTQEDIEIVDRVLKELEEEKAWELPLDKRDAPPLPQK
jgi:NACalpha-BTF3-like transcription factor